MTQQSTTKAYNTFVKGIITEAGPLTFPENAALDIENVVLNREGSLQRRLGMDFEDNFVLRTVTLADDDALASFLWENAANDVDNQLAVVQAGRTLFIFNAKQNSVSGNLVATVDLSPYITGKTVITVAAGLGYLFIDEPTTDPLYLSFNPATNAVTVTEYTMKIRDIFGVDDGLAVDNQPAALSTEHNYNLLNQGWDSTKITAYKADAGSVYPSNAQQWFVGKDVNDDFQAALLKKQDFGTTPAPKGRYVIDAFARSTSRDAASGLTTAADLETGRPSVVGFGFERVFHAGVQSNVIAASETRPNMTGFVFYSRTLRSVKDASQYHTDADPTSEVDSDLVDTDGGFVNIPNSGPIHKLIQKDNAMLVFAENGIWMLEGDEGGFRATANQVKKLSDFGVLSGSSIVDVEEAILYWNKGGIYLLGVDPDSGRLSSKSISEDSIQTLYNSINKVAKTNAVGTFDPVNRRVTWMYNDELDYDGVNFKNRYNKELVLDLVLTAFYKHSISSYLSPSPYIAGYLPTPDFLLREEGIRSRGDTITKYMTVQFINPATDAASVSFAYYRDPTFRDWKSLDGIGASFLSYLVTGYEIFGDSAREKQINYLTTHFKFTEDTVVDDGLGNLIPTNPSGCYVQAQWDWANHPDSGKWGQTIQAYRLLRPYIPLAAGPVNYGQEVITNKHRLPGSGKSVSLYFSSEDDKDFYLYGWSMRAAGAANV